MEQITKGIRGLRVLASVNLDWLVWPLAILSLLYAWGHLSGL